MNPKITKNGKWYRDSNQDFHRDDGPAVEWADGTKYWCKHGRYHREDGPAFETANGSKEYWLEGIQYTEEEYWKKIKELKKCKLFKLKDKKIEWI